MIKQSIGAISLVVKDYDEAIDFYVNKCQFELLEDTAMPEGKRWVRVAPQNSEGTALLLAKADGEQQLNAVGQQAGGRVWLFLETNDFYRDYQYMKNAGVKFNETPREEVYGTVAVFEDLYGNKWDLIQTAQKI